MKLAKTGLAALSLAILAACGGGGDPPAAPSAGTTPPTGTVPPAGTPPAVTPPATTPPATTPPAVTPPVVTPPVPTPPAAVPLVTPSVSAQAQALAARLDDLFRTAVPVTGAAFTSVRDGCYLNNGYTKDMSITEIDANSAKHLASEAYLIGSTRTNLRVVAERNITNSDGSTRNEIDTLYDINYADGSKATDAANTMVTGSTVGLCATSENSAEPRFLGNQRVVGVSVRARNERNEQRNRLSGAPTTTAVLYANLMQFNVIDPQGNATYAVVSGPGTTTISGVATPFAMKLLSTRLMKLDPLLAGKNGNFSNWKPEDAFRICRTPSNLIGNANNSLPASATDCTLGASGTSRGWTIGVPASGATVQQLASADTNFANYGFVVGGTYTFKIYNDDGWKTINGEANRTPIATYTAVNDSLPYTFAQMVGNSGLADHRFPAITSNLSPASMAYAVTFGPPGSLSLAWNSPATQTDGRVFRLTEAGESFQGTRLTSVPGTPWPAERFYNPTYLPGNATSVNNVPVTPAPATIQFKSYAEFGITYTDRNGGRMYSSVSFN